MIACRYEISQYLRAPMLLFSIYLSMTCPVDSCWGWGAVGWGGVQWGGVGGREKGVFKEDL